MENLNAEFRRLLEEKNDLETGIWDAEEINDVAKLTSLQDRLLIVKIMLAEERIRLNKRKEELSKLDKENEEKMKIEQEKQRKEQKNKEKMEELENYYKQFEERVSEAFKTQDFSDIFLSCNVPEQNFTLAVQRKLCKIYAWQKRQQVRLEKILSKQRAYSTNKAAIAEKMRSNLEKLGPKYSLEEMQKAIMEMIPDDENDDYVRGQESESDDDLPKAIADESGILKEGYSYEDPFDYISRLKIKSIDGNEKAQRQLNNTINQVNDLNEILQTKIKLHDDDFKKLKLEYERKTQVYMKKLSEQTASVNQLKEMLKHYSETKSITEAESNNEKKLKTELEKLQKKFSEMKEEPIKNEGKQESSEQLMKENKKLKDELATLNISLKDIKQKSREALLLVDEVSLLKTKLTNAINSEKKAKTALENVEKDVNKRIAKLNEESEQVIEELKEKVEEKGQEIEELTNNKSRLQAIIQGLSDEITECENKSMEDKKIFEQQISDLTDTITEKKLENEKLAINHNNIVNNLEQQHKLEIDDIRVRVIQPLNEIVNKRMHEAHKLQDEALKFKLQAESLERDLVKIKAEWDRILEIKEHIAYKKGLKDAKIKEIREIAVQTDIVNDDYKIVRNYTPEHILEEALDEYWKFRRTERARIMTAEGEIGGYNYISADEKKITAFLQEYKNKYPESSYVKWSDESVNDRYVRGSMYTGPIKSMLEDVNAIGLLKHKLSDKLQEIESNGIEKREKAVQDILIEAEEKVKQGILLQSRLPDASSPIQGNLTIFKQLLTEIDNWPEENFRVNMPLKFFSYHLSQWKTVYDGVFTGFKRKFYMVNQNTLSREQSCVMFKLLVNLNLLTGSRSHIWYGNHLNRTFNNKDYRKHDGPGKNSKHDYLMNRAQNTFFDWYGDDARVCYEEMTAKLNSEGATKYKILLKTIGSTYIGRNFDFTVSG